MMNVNRRYVEPYSRSALFLQTFELEATIRLINCDCIDKALFVNPNITSEYIDEKKNNSHCFVVEHIITLPPYKEWGNFWIT